MLLSYTFASRFGSGYPPVFSSATSPRATGTNVLFRAAHALRWAWALGTRGRGQAFGRAEYADTVVRKWLDQARNVSFERELHRFGVRSTWSEWKRRPLVPEIVFGHRMLDWPAIATDPNRFYFGTTDLFLKSSTSTGPSSTRTGRSPTATSAPSTGSRESTFRNRNARVRVRTTP